MAERERIDLSRISVSDMVDQFVAAMARYESRIPLERRADWLDLAARLLVLRSRLLLPRSSEAERAVLDEVERQRIVATLGRDEVQTAILTQRPSR